MKKRALAAAVLAAALLFAGCAVTPKRQTLPLKRPEAALPTPVPADQLTFEMDKMYIPQLSKLDSLGYSDTPRDLLLGWAGGDALLGIQVLESDISEEERGQRAALYELAAKYYGIDTGAEKAAAYRLDLVRMDYRYSFVQRVATLPENCLSALPSHDGSMLACQYVHFTTEDTAMLLYCIINTATGNLVWQGRMPADTGEMQWSNNDRFLCFGGQGDDLVYLFEVENALMDVVYTEEDLRARLPDARQATLAYVDDVRQQVVLQVESSREGSYLLRFDFWGDNSTEPQLVPDYYAEEGSVQWQFTDGQNGLALVDGTLIHVPLTENTLPQTVAAGVTAFTLSPDGKYIAYVQGGTYTGSDLCVARYNGGLLVNPKTVYKGLTGAASGNMAFSPGSRQLLMTMARRTGSGTRQTVVLEFR